MLDQIPNDKSLVVLASYRTGSTALCDLLAKKYMIKNFDEVYHLRFPWRTKQFNIWRARNYKTIIKIMPDQMPPHKEQEKIFADAFVIGITRRDVVAQIASFYICHITQHWHDFKNNIAKNYIIDIDKFELENQVRHIVNMNSQYQLLAQQHCMIQYYYEDIKDKLLDSDFITYHKPANYDEICQTVGTVLSKIIV